jgi:phospholipid N-methyltransferase
MTERSANTLQFAAAFVANPAATGSLLPSSRFLGRRMLRRIDWSNAGVVVELGPGVGGFTRQILARMRPDAKLLAIELNPKLAGVLSNSVRDPRLHVVPGSALRLEKHLRMLGVQKADCIVCSLPFANMRSEVRFAILRKSCQSLSAQGSLVLFQYSKILVPVLRSLFPSVRAEFEWRNFPPAHVFSCTRSTSVDPQSGVNLALGGQYLWNAE